MEFGKKFSADTYEYSESDFFSLIHDLDYHLTSVTMEPIAAFGDCRDWYAIAIPNDFRRGDLLERIVHQGLTSFLDNPRDELDWSG